MPVQHVMFRVTEDGQYSADNLESQDIPPVLSQLTAESALNEEGMEEIEVGAAVDESSTDETYQTTILDHTSEDYEILTAGPYYPIHISKDLGSSDGDDDDDDDDSTEYESIGDVVSENFIIIETEGSKKKTRRKTLKWIFLFCSLLSLMALILSTLFITRWQKERRRIRRQRFGEFDKLEQVAMSSDTNSVSAELQSSSPPPPTITTPMPATPEDIDTTIRSAAATDSDTSNNTMTPTPNSTLTLTSPTPSPISTTQSLTPSPIQALTTPQPNSIPDITSGPTTASPTTPTFAESTTIATALPTNVDGALLLEILSDYTDVDLLRNISTPQGKALQTILASEDLGLELAGQFQLLQRYALITLYYSTSPSKWIRSFGWNSFSENECSWFGINTCRFLGDGELAVSNIDLSSNGLTGSIPPEICLLSLVSDRIDKIDLSGNILSGPIPDCITDIKSIEELSLQHNNLSGFLPKQLLALPNLSVIKLNDNNFTGSLYGAFGDGGMGGSNSLVHIDLHNNYFNGSIPIAFATYPNLQTVQLSQNNLEGVVDSSLCPSADNTILTFDVDCDEVECACCSNC